MLDPVTFDRLFFALSMAFHMIFVTITMGLSILVSIYELRYIKSKKIEYKVLAKKLAKALVLSFAFGTASGTLIAFELFSLFPKFMAVASQVAILPFYVEVFAFFLETIALIMYFYFWENFKNLYAHWLLSILVIIGTASSAILITMINAFMNTPAGFNIANFISTGKITDVNPWAVFNGPSTWSEEYHVITTTYAAAGFMMLAIFSYYYKKTKDRIAEIMKNGMKTSSIFAGISILLAGISGHFTELMLLTEQPLKYAAIELNFYPATSNAPELIGGLYYNNSTYFYISIPNLQSFLAYFPSGNGYLPGLYEYPANLWPPLYIHLTFDLMVFGGILLGIFALILFVSIIFKKDIFNKRTIINGSIISGFLAMAVYDAGWVTNEVGRQPWIIYNVMTVEEAANVSSVIIPIGFSIMVFYLVSIPITILYILKILKVKVEEISNT